MILELSPLSAPRPFPDTMGDRDPFAPAPSLLEALEGSEENRARLASGEALVVATGQQPCFPLPLGLTLQKAATALSLAEAESRRLGAPVLPLFWNGADDSDFEEARGQYLPRQGQGRMHVSLPASLHRRGAMVGDLPLKRAWADLPRCGDLQWRPRDEEDLGSFQGRLLREIFPELLVLDARVPAISQAAHELYRRYADRRKAYGDDLDAAGGQMEDANLERPLRPGLGLRALWFRSKGRRVLPPEEDYREALAGRLDEEPPALLPNASLRPLVQDFILPVQAVVLGPSEWLYHHQLRPGFQRLGVPFPRPWPRLQAGTAGEGSWGVPPGGRQYSPLAGGPSALADPRLMLEAARRHLAEWSEKGYYRMILED